jgi:dTDP-4-amino-4,6-dideoxygalactose transaminase
VYGLKNCGRGRHRDRRRYVLGGSYRMTELQAALLLAQFTRLDEQVNHRDRNGRWLDRELARTEGIRPLHRDPRIERQSYYAYVFRYDAAAFGGLPVEVFRAALEAEGVPCGPTYGPVYATDLWGPAPYQGWRMASGKVADRVDDEAVLLAHEMLLADEEDMADIVEAVRKIQAHRDELADLEVEKPLPASVAGPRRGISTT